MIHIVYKYQKETLEYLEETRERLEKLTDARMKLKIGTIRDSFLNMSGTEYYEDTRDLFFCINPKESYIDKTFMSVGEIPINKDYGVCDEAFVRLDSNLFLKLNDFIDKIYKNKHEREEFHEKLNKELEALNKSL